MTVVASNYARKANAGTQSASSSDHAVGGARTVTPHKIMIRDIQRAVAAHYSVSPDVLISACRSKRVVRPRQIAMYLARRLTQRSLHDLGYRFGGRDHTTVLHAVQKIETLAATDAAMAADLVAIEQQIRSA